MKKILINPYKKGTTGRRKTNFPDVVKKLNLSETERKTGVYVILEKKTRKVLYVGLSNGNLYSTAYRHFQLWNDRSLQYSYYQRSDHYTTTDKNRLLYFIFCPFSKAYILEAFLIRKYQPTNNNYKFEKADVILSELKKPKNKKLTKEENESFLLFKEEEPPF